MLAQAGAETAPQQAASRLPMPDVQGLVILIRNAIVALHQANETGNYAVLRATAAPAFQQTTSPAGLTEVFADLRSRGLDLDTVTVVNPGLHRDPAIDEQGLLRLVGFFDAGEVKLDFDLAFQLVDGRWRLFGVGVFPPDADEGEESAEAAAEAEELPIEPTMPDAATMVRLIRGSVIALNQANLVGDYSVLRDLAAPGFREANSLAELSAIFSDLRARGLDLGPVAVIDPQLFRQPAIDERGFLRLTGFFPSRPEQVNYDLAYQFVDGDWRLFGIGLNTSREEPAPVADSAPQEDQSDGAGRREVAANSGTGVDQPNSERSSRTEPPTPRLRPGP